MSLNNKNLCSESTNCKTIFALNVTNEIDIDLYGLLKKKEK